jgi:Transglycosylase SLT domain
MSFGSLPPAWTRAACVAIAVCAGACLPGRASAEIITLSTGRTLSVKSHRFDGDSVVFSMRGGGEIACGRSLVVRIDPDEVPYPEPADPGDTASDVTGPFAAMIAAAAERYGLDARLLESVIRAESNFSARARSPKGAMGLMQLMPGTAKQYAVDDPYDPAANIEAGARHLRMLLDRYDLRRALAAYNAGEAAVAKYGGVPPYPETRGYVAKILRRLSDQRVEIASVAARAPVAP